MNRLTIIQKFANQLNAQTYLEIGVSTGWLFFKVKVPYKIAVDPKFALPWYNILRRLLNYRSNTFFETTSDSFFEKHSDILKKLGGVDVAFIDGLHTYEQAYHDVLNTLPFLSNGGIILMHDCNPPNEACAFPAKNIYEYRKLASEGLIPGYLNSWNGDVWKAIVKLRSQHPELKTGVLDLDWGIGYVYKIDKKMETPYNQAI